MNYITEMKAFYDRLETNPLPSPAIALWHALMHIANKTGWQQEFTVAVSVLEIKTGLNVQAVKRARNKLKEAGLIDWKSRNGKQSAIYQIHSFAVQNDDNNVPQPVPQCVPQYEPQPVPQCVPINKQNKTKQEIKRKNNKKEKGEEGPTAKVFHPPTVEQVRAYCLERENKVDAERFVDYYAAKGWLIGKTKMKDWRAAVRTWEKNADDKAAQKGWNPWEGVPKP